jgi:hypothetical protein
LNAVDIVIRENHLPGLRGGIEYPHFGSAMIRSCLMSAQLHYSSIHS